MKKVKPKSNLTQVQKLSLLYVPKEDRMKLTIHSDSQQVVFWITRYFYLSTLFELDTFFENQNIDTAQINQKIKKENKKQIKVEFAKERISHTYLLEEIKIRIVNERKGIMTLFQSGDFELRTMFSVDKFLELYAALKRNYPTKEWGIL